jgi:rhamnulose-1-phosphate aldolase
MCPEVRVYVPRGIHCTPYSITQSDDLAKSTIEGFDYRDLALWEKHGATTTAPTIMQAWDFLDVANKGAKLLLGCWAAGFEPKGLTPTEIKDLEELFKL